MKYASIPPPDWRAALYILAHGILLYRRAAATTQADDLAAAIDTLEDARGLVKIGSGVHGTSSTYLADLRLRRFAGAGEPIDLESSVQDALSVVVSKRANQSEQVFAAKILAQACLKRFDAVHSLDDLEMALDAAKFALEHAVNPFLVAEVQGLLASGLRHRFRRTHDPADLDAAIEAYKSALQYLEQESAILAVLTDGLGNCFADRYESKKLPADLDEAIACSYRALHLFPTDSTNRALAFANLGLSLIRRGRDRNDLFALAEALASFRSGLALPPIALDVIVRLHNGIAEALLVMDVLQHTTEHLDEALAALEEAFSAALTGEQDLPVRYRLGRQEGIGGIANRLVGTLLLRAAKNKSTAASDLWRAISIGEAGKVVLLSQELLRRSLPPPDGVSKELIEWEAQLLTHLAALDVHEMSPSATVTTAREHRRIVLRSRIRSALDLAWREMANTCPAGKNYVEMRQQLPTALINALKLGSRINVLMSLLETQQLAPDASWRSGLCLLVLWPSRSDPEVEFSVTDNPLPEAKARLMANLQEDRGRGARPDTWWQELADLIRCDRRMMHATIVLSLSEHGTGLPWQVLFERGGWSEPDGTPAPVVVVASFALLAVSKSRSKIGWHEFKDAAEHFNIRDEDGLAENILFSSRMESLPSSGPLVVGNPSADLDSASNEAVSVGRILGVKPLVGAEATVAAVKDAFARSSLVHIAAHAQFDADDPLESSIRLADGELKARRLLGEWNTSDLVVLSACESGADRPILGGELVGFATALLRSGVQTVVASLWPVDDAATRTLMTRFHQALVQKIPVPKALMNAMSYVRSQPGWDLPYYWAPFIVLTQRVE